MAGPWTCQAFTGRCPRDARAKAGALTFDYVIVGAGFCGSTSVERLARKYYNMDPVTALVLARPEVLVITSWYGPGLKVLVKLPRPCPV